MSEFQQKIAAAEELLRARQLDALVLRRVSSVAWATCGAPTHVNTAADTGIATLLIKPGEQHLITNRIEAPRLEREEGLAAQGWRFHVGNWFEADTALAALTAGLRVGSDTSLGGATDVSGEVSRMRSLLLPEEQDRFRTLGRLSADAMQAAISKVQPGMTEYEIAATLAFEVQRRGAQPIVNLIATDERIFGYRHPLPKGKKLDKYAMLVLCARQHGLVASITRLVHFGPLPEEVRQKANAVAQIDAASINGSRPGRTYGDVFAGALAAYAAVGYPDEWQLHHQGGPAAYEPREVIVSPGATDTVVTGMAFAWNPSITGAKSEDTILVGAQENEVLTTIDGWPMITVESGGTVTLRPDIWVR